MIERAQTLIVISEGKTFSEEPFAFLFLNTQPRNLEIVQKKLQEIPQALSADTVLGLFDVIAAVRANNKEDLKELICQIQTKVPHIQGTLTSIVASLY
jgi:DNA-binding Lrp family transcriptional regulator